MGLSACVYETLKFRLCDHKLGSFHENLLHVARSGTTEKGASW